MSLKVTLAKITLILLLWGVVFGVAVYQHELAHYQINKVFGCKINEIHMDLFKPYTEGKRCTGDRNTWALAHSINEAVHYNFTMLFLLLLLVILVKGFY